MKESNLNYQDIYDFSDKPINVCLVGEVLIDIIQKKITNQPIYSIGGSPFNIAKYLTKLNIKNKFYGSIGNDAFGEKIITEINSKKIDAHINHTDKATSYVKITQTSSTPNPKFYRQADNYIYISDNLLKDLSDSKILHFTFWPLSKEPSLSTILSLVEKAKANNTLIGFDPNYHPFLDDNDTTGFEIVKDIINKVDIIKPSLDDSERLFGKRNIEQYLKIYENLGAKLIIMTLGKDGLIARYKKQTIKLPSFATKVIDSTGAGDAFWSGLYAGLTSKYTIEDSLKIGLLCSAENLKVIGSDMDLPSFEELSKKIRG